MKLYGHNLPRGEAVNRPDAKRNRLLKLKSRRKLWLDVHLWLGLGLGLFLSIFGITGSILVFHLEINELLNPKLLTVNVPEANPVYKPLAEIFQVGKATMPNHAANTFATYPRNNEAAIKMAFSLPLSGNKAGVTESWEVYVNPYTAKAIGKRLMSSSDGPFPKTFIGFIFELHYALFLGEDPGYLIVGIMGALLIISTLTGLIVWWPLTGKWRQAVTIKFKASTERLNFDLHKTFGFYSAVVLIPVLFSGVYMDIPQHVVPVLELFSPATYRYWFKSNPTSVKPSITMADAVSIAEKRYPTGRADWIYGATEPTGTYSVCKDGVEEAGSLLHRRCVVIDRYSGAILDVDDPAIGTAGEVFTDWQWPLHSGQAFGWTGRILVFLSGLACPVLFVTGVIRWLQKRKAKRLHKSQQTTNRIFQRP
ncbi:MAG: PepSY domain-containing protein [Methyloglobulus sp.]|nr:PepSY domain-containing protein [Methyloglobulus sp.]